MTKLRSAVYTNALSSLSFPISFPTKRLNTEDEAGALNYLDLESGISCQQTNKKLSLARGNSLEPESPIPVYDKPASTLHSLAPTLTGHLLRRPRSPPEGSLYFPAE